MQGGGSARVPSAACQVLHERSFAAACWALSNERDASGQSLNSGKRAGRGPRAAQILWVV